MDLFTLNLYAAAASPLVGSAIAAGAARFAEGRAWDATPSACPACHRRLGFLEMTPVLGWVALRGRCHGCSAPISASYPFIELSAMAVAAWAGLAVPPEAFGFTCILGWLLLALSVIDFRTRRLPDALTLTTFITGMAAAMLFEPARVADHLIGALAGYGLFVAVEKTFRRLRGIDGLGRGDGKLLGALGAWTGWQALPSIILVGAVGALCVMMLSAWARREQAHATTSIAFGPYLALGGWVAWLYGPVFFQIVSIQT